MKIPEIIQNLQNKPEQTRTRIFWSASTVAVIVVVAVWLVSFKNDVKNITLSGSQTTANATKESTPHYLSLESSELKDDHLLIYFSAQNDTGDILNFSQISNISLIIDGKKYQPSKITTRTNTDFVQKILSQSQNFGVLTFEKITKGYGQLTFDNLFFEQSPQDTKEVIPLNLDKLPLSTGN
jgi:hypothetical protein